MGCTNCDNNDLLNNENKKVATGNIEYDGINFTCTTDPSLDTVSTDSLNTVLLRLLNAVCEDNGCCISTVTYSTLSTLISTSALIPNSVYRFPYYTKHLINGGTSEYNDTTIHHDPGTGVKNTFTPETEYILVRAIDSSKIALEAVSESYPRDIIHYDHTLNRTEDNLQDRPGFITFRHDTDNDVSAHFDWRNVLHRRWDLDVKRDRDAEYNVALNYNAASAYNHELAYKNPAPSTVGAIPPFANYNSSGNSDLGFLLTPNETTYRDFKTFVSYGTPLWFVTASSKESPRFKNVHIEKSESVARIVGSASSSPIETSGGGVVGSPYPSLANVVLFTRSAENIFIGQNASGITFTGRTVREINIGHNNENIIIGGTYGKPDYTTPLEPKVTGYNDDLKIGNNNRNIMIADNNRALKIGHSNIGITFNRYSFNVSIGNHNTKIYWDLCFSSYIKDWNESVDTSNSGGVHIGSLNKNINIVNCSAGNHVNSLLKNIPDGFTSTIAELSAAQPSVSIANSGFNLFIANSTGIKLGDVCTYSIFLQSNTVLIGERGSNISMRNCFDVEVGSYLYSAEISTVNTLKVGRNCQNIKLWNSSFVKIGDNILTSAIGWGSQDIVIGSNGSNILVSAGYKLTLGESLSGITIRNTAYGTIGNGSNNVYLETATQFSIGLNCYNIIISTLNVTQKPTLPIGSNMFTTISSYDWHILDPRAALYTLRTSVASNALSPIYSTEVINSIATFIGYTAGVAPNYNTVGDGCENVNIVASNYNTVGNECTFIQIGTDSIVDYALKFTSGLSDGAGSTPAYTIPNLTALVTGNTGGNCNNNDIENNCSYIKFYGSNKTQNKISSNSPGITATLARTFVNNKVLTHPVSNLTLSTNFTGKVFDKSDGNNVWEQSINSSGVLQTPTKLQ